MSDVTAAAPAVAVEFLVELTNVNPEGRLFDLIYRRVIGVIIRTGKTSAVLFGMQTFPDVTICNLNPMNVVDRKQWITYADDVAEKKTQWSCEMIRSQFDVKMIDEECDYVWSKLQLPKGFFSNLPVFNDSYDENTGIIVNSSLYDWGYGYSDAKYTIRSVWHPDYYKCYTIHVNPKDNQVNLRDVLMGSVSQLLSY
jgi:hypothetical protein